MHKKFKIKTGDTVIVITGKDKGKTGNVISVIKTKDRVIVERKIMHPMYKKFVTKSKKFAAHDGENKFKVGDVVNIRECSPISKNKRFEVIY